MALRRSQRFSTSDGTTLLILRLLVHANGLLIEFIIVVMCVRAYVMA